jgi:tetratricopeptide (TPR) repeat protein
VETVLNNWEKVDSTDEKLLSAKFDYYFNKGQVTQVVTKSSKKYLGMNPVLTLKDSLGNDVYYFQEVMYDDENYGTALQVVDKAVSLYPDKLDYRFLKANAYIAYEKESPDMALAYLLSLAKEDVARKTPWVFDGKVAEEGFFADAMQEYCYSFFVLATPSARNAFFELSQHLCKLFPDKVDYLNNIGSYYLVSENYKSALKTYSKVLKKYPEDLTAIQNCVLASRMMRDIKLEVKYLQMMVKYAPEKDALAAKSRIEALSKK